MMMRLLVGIVVLAALAAQTVASAQQRGLTFGVISQRSPVLTAQYWNPILRYVSERAGVTLDLRVARTGQEHAASVARGEFDFIYSNHNFAPENDGAGYRVLARPARAAVSGQIVVLADSPIRTLADLQGREVAFPSNAAFLGYHVPMDALVRSRIAVLSHFAGNQEGAMTQLKARRVAAAGVNSQVMQDYARRENVEYRVLWNSEPFHNLPISVLPAVSAGTVRAVRDVLIGMANDPQGARLLAESAALLREEPPFGFVPATDQDYENLRLFHKAALVKADPR
jgi:phosphonate transport system substrate-binding protein